MTLTLRSRLTLVYAALFGALLAALAVVSYRALAYQLDADVTANLAELTSGLHGYLRFPEGRPTVVFDVNDPDQAAFVEEATRYHAIFDAASGEIVEQSEALGPLGLQFTAAEVRQFRDRPVPLDLHTDYGRIRLSNSVVTGPDGRRYLLQVGVSLASMDQVLKRFLLLLMFIVPAGLAVTVVVGRWMAGIALTPLSRVAEAARQIDIADLRTRLPVRGVHDELDDVARAFNGTLARLEDAVAEMRQFSTALAHEIRTPLAVLRSGIESAMFEPPGEHTRRRLGEQLEEIDKLNRLIAQILTLARAEAGEIPIAFTEVDLANLAVSIVEQIEPVAAAKRISLLCEPAGALMVRGDPEWLKRMLLNLLDNAIKFTNDGGQVVVTVARRGSMGTLAVRDTGIGIDAGARPHIFERFFRADPARSGSVEGVGLGLSLARWIADRHHGRIDVDSEPRHGSTFTAHIPLIASPSD